MSGLPYVSSPEKTKGKKKEKIRILRLKESEADKLYSWLIKDEVEYHENLVH